MSGVKGRSGTNKHKDKPWADALRVAVFRTEEDGKKRLVKIAERCALAAASGDMQAIKEIGDRLDGRAHQTIEAEVATVQYVIEVPVLIPSSQEWERTAKLQ